MMNEDDKNRIVSLLEELLSCKATEARDGEIHEEISALSPDPLWSDYIFWSDDFVNEDCKLDSQKFLNKISEYPNSDDYKIKSRIIKLAEQLINRDFTEISEIEIVNELNDLSPNISWMNYIFADKSCLHSDGKIDIGKFLNKIFDESWNENFR